MHIVANTLVYYKAKYRRAVGLFYHNNQDLPILTYYSDDPQLHPKWHLEPKFKLLTNITFAFRYNGFCNALTICRPASIFIV